MEFTVGLFSLKGAFAVYVTSQFRIIIWFREIFLVKKVIQAMGNFRTVFKGRAGIGCTEQYHQKRKEYDYKDRCIYEMIKVEYLTWYLCIFNGFKHEIGLLE